MPHISLIIVVERASSSVEEEEEEEGAALYLISSHLIQQQLAAADKTKSRRTIPWPGLYNGYSTVIQLLYNECEKKPSKDSVGYIQL